MAVQTQSKSVPTGMETYEVKYMIGRQAGSATKGKQEIVADSLGHDNPFNLPVVWIPGGDWTPTDGSFQRASGITRWKIDNDGWVWKYRLSFTTTEAYNYTFTDQTGQGYGCDVFIAGDHYIDYNSDQPTIIQVSGI